MNPGKVYLVGAGPGDVGLMTLKGKAAIEKADTIVYDRLANPRLLSWRKKDAKLIYVGKTPDHHTLKQEEINEVLVEEAQEGRIVTRLKGGDPYVFGRGGEEGERLRQAGIAFEVVPGITSAIAAPSYAGIPVTHRHLTSTFTVITGHEDPEKETSQINWPRLAQDPGTLIFLMGVGNLAKIVAELKKHGKDETTPVALVQWGTRPEQRVVTGTLQNIVDVVKEAGITSPAIILIGDVVTMRDTLRWFEDKPLFGQRILVTRAREQASDLSEAIESLGGEAWEFPTIRVEEPKDWAPVDTAMEQLAQYQWMVFTSPNGVERFFKRLAHNNKDIRSLGDIKICAIGPSTEKALARRGLKVHVVPERFQNEYVLEAMKPLVQAGDRVLVPRSSLGRAVLVDTLRTFGCEVDEVIVYQTVLEGEAEKALLLDKLEAGEITMVTATSSSTIQNLVTLLGDKIELLQSIPIASIGPVTTERAEKLGLSVALQAESYTIAGLVDAILAYTKKEGDARVS